ncbi:MAG TPA: pyridoxal-phosphate dependent enzyme, partial [Ktedonobacteraceae bacterium]
MRVIDNHTVTETPYDAQQAVTIADIWEAHKLLKPYLHHTPLTPSRTLHDLTGADIYLKAENMQRSGSFKVRGAIYKLSRLAEKDYHRGVIAASAGNHAQGVAIAAANSVDDAKVL